jgi:glycine reductase complex component B subunit alpha and beta
MAPPPMRLERRVHRVREIGFAPRTSLEGGRLGIDRQGLVDLVLADDRLTHCNVELVAGGESARVVHICGTVEPHWREQGPTFPGWESDARMAGDGVTHRLAGVGVTTCCELPWRKTGGIQIPRENIAELRGPMAELSPLWSLQNVILEVALREGLPDEECDRAVHVAALRVASHLAKAVAAEHAPDEVETFSLGPVDPSLPRVVYMAQITSQGPFAGTFYYGGYLDRLLPTIVHPNELLDGAIVDGNMAGPTIRIPTIVHQNNPVITGLYRDHGVDLCFAGVVLMRGHYYGMDDKFRVAAQASKLVRWLGADGAIFTWENAGNGLMETMYTLQSCERMGIKSVLITFEHGGAKGDDSPLQFYVPEAVAMVSSGSMDEPLTLPEVERVLGGGDTIRLNPQMGGERVPARGPINLDWRLEMYAAAGQAGQHRYGREDI